MTKPNETSTSPTTPPAPGGAQPSDTLPTAPTETTTTSASAEKSDKRPSVKIPSDNLLRKEAEEILARLWNLVEEYSEYYSRKASREPLPVISNEALRAELKARRAYVRDVERERDHWKSQYFAANSRVPGQSQDLRPAAPEEPWRERARAWLEINAPPHLRERIRELVASSEGEEGEGGEE